MKVYINGKLLPEDKACVSVFDRGLSYGDGLFETIKAVGSSPVFLKEHLERLKSGAEFLGIPVKFLKPLENAIRRGTIKKLLKANGLGNGEAYIKIIVTRGADKGGHAPPKIIKPTIIIIAKPIDVKGILKLKEQGVTGVPMLWPHPAIPCVKTLNYLPSVLAKAEAVRQNAFEGIFVNKNGYISEGSSTNVFIISKGVLKTPPAQSTALAGVTRKAVIKLAKGLGLKAVERNITTKNLLKSDEAFLTNSILEIVPLVRFGSKKIGTGNPGAITRVLQTVYASIVEG